MWSALPGKDAIPTARADPRPRSAGVVGAYGASGGDHDVTLVTHGASRHQMSAQRMVHAAKVLAALRFNEPAAAPGTGEGFVPSQGTRADPGNIRMVRQQFLDEGRWLLAIRDQVDAAPPTPIAVSRCDTASYRSRSESFHGVRGWHASTPHLHCSLRNKWAGCLPRPERSVQYRFLVWEEKSLGGIAGIERWPCPPGTVVRTRSQCRSGSGSWQPALPPGSSRDGH